MKHTRIKIMCQSAILLALAVALSYVKIFQLPFDGSVTLFSMLPICIVSMSRKGMLIPLFGVKTIVESFIRPPIIFVSMVIS